MGTYGEGKYEVRDIRKNLVVRFTRFRDAKIWAESYGTGQCVWMINRDGMYELAYEVR